MLIGHCTRDPVLAIALGEATQRARPDATLVRIEGASHEDASLVDPARYREALRALVARSRRSERRREGLREPTPEKDPGTAVSPGRKAWRPP